MSMSPLESRKYLLLAESELNRAQMTEEWQLLELEVQALAGRAGTLYALGSAAATLVAGLGSRRHKARVAEVEKPSWLQSILRGADWLVAVWPSFRPPRGG